MSPEAITLRLELLARESRHSRPPPRPDMSPEAVTRRLEDWSALTALCLALARAGRSPSNAGGAP